MLPGINKLHTVKGQICAVRRNAHPARAYAPGPDGVDLGVVVGVAPAERRVQRLVKGPERDVLAGQAGKADQPGQSEIAQVRLAGLPFDQDVAGRYREHILSKGGTKPGMELYEAFRGRTPTIDALLENRGLIGR